MWRGTNSNLTVLLLLCVLFPMDTWAGVLPFTKSNAGPKLGTYNVASRQRREIYLTFQDSSQAICIGLCMFHERRSYYRCERKCPIGHQKILSTMGRPKKTKDKSD